MIKCKNCEREYPKEKVLEFFNGKIPDYAEGYCTPRCASKELNVDTHKPLDAGQILGLGKLDYKGCCQQQDHTYDNFDSSVVADWDHEHLRIGITWTGYAGKAEIHQQINILCGKEDQDQVIISATNGDDRETAVNPFPIHKDSWKVFVEAVKTMDLMMNNK